VPVKLNYAGFGSNTRKPTMFSTFGNYQMVQAAPKVKFDAEQ